MADAGSESALVERDAYLDELIDMSPSTDSLLDEVRKCMIYRGMYSYAPKQSHPNGFINRAEVIMMLHQEHVDWDTFHTNLIKAISDNRASNKTNQYTRSRIHSDQKFQLYHLLARSFPSFLSNAIGI